MSKPLATIKSVADIEELEGRLRPLLNAGKKLEALKQLREGLGCGLKEAKDLVDQMVCGQTLKQLINFSDSQASQSPLLSSNRKD